MRLVKLSVKALETEDYLLFTGVTSEGGPLDPDTCAKLLAIPGTVGQPCLLTEAMRASLDQQLTTERQSFLARALSRSAVVAAGAALRPATQLACSLHAAGGKLDRWALRLVEPGRAPPGCRLGSRTRREDFLTVPRAIS